MNHLAKIFTVVCGSMITFCNPGPQKKPAKQLSGGTGYFSPDDTPTGMSGGSSGFSSGQSGSAGISGASGSSGGASTGGVSGNGHSGVSGGISSNETGDSFPRPRSGTFDANFASDGIAEIESDAQTGLMGLGAALDATGAITIGCQVERYSDDGNLGFGLARFNPASGHLDSGFGTNGLVLTAVGGGVNSAYGMTTDGDKILLTGFGQKTNSVWETSGIGLARYNSNGTFDSTFSADGWLIAGTDLGIYANAVAIQNDQKIFTAGYKMDREISRDGNSAVMVSRIMLARFSSSGSIDTTFGDKGISIIGGKWSTANAIVIRPDGSIVIGGTNASTYDSSHMSVMQVGSQGKTIQGFSGGAGIPNPSVVNAMALLPNGKIIAVGSAKGSNGTSDLAIAQFNTDGSLDQSFGTNGFTLTDVAGNDDEAKAVAVTGDGSIIVAGSGKVVAPWYDALRPTLVVAKYSKSGILDQTFGERGIIKGDRLNANGFRASTALGLLPMPKGTIVVVGWVWPSSQRAFLSQSIIPYKIFLVSIFP